MASLDRIVAGLSCRDVLADLSEMVDGALPADRLDAIGRHVAECHVCESFGGRFGGMVRQIRESWSAHPVPLPTGVAARLRARLAKETGQG